MLADLRLEYTGLVEPQDAFGLVLGVRQADLGLIEPPVDLGLLSTSGNWRAGWSWLVLGLQ